MQARPEKLTDEARELLIDPANILLLSAASSWEIAIKYALGKLPLPAPPASYVPDRLRRGGVTPLAAGSRRWPGVRVPGSSPQFCR